MPLARYRWCGGLLLTLLGAALALGQGKDELPAPRPEERETQASDLRDCARPVLEGPGFSEQQVVKPTLPPAAQAPDRALPINLATALRLADGRALLIAAAEASVQVAAAELDRARVLWLPSIYTGLDYVRHDGATTQTNRSVPPQTPTTQLAGTLINNSYQQMVLGGGYQASFATTDAVFIPLAARQVLRARQADVQAARNDTLLEVAEAYFTVEQAQGRLAGAVDAVAKGKVLTRQVEGLAKGLVPPIEVERVRATVEELEQEAALALQDWRIASATLIRLLRLDPTTTVQPLEPPHLQITLIAPNRCIDELIPIALTNRPELAAQQALVQATLERLRQERLRPLIPSVVLRGNATPASPLAGGAYVTGPNSTLNQWGARHDYDAALLWELRNLGAGNRALVRERQAQQRLALVELFRVQDTIAAEVAQALARLESASYRIGRAELGLKSAQASYAGNVKGLSETTRFGDLLQPIMRPQEVTAALQQLDQAYRNYYLSVADYNRAQFRLYRNLGFAAGVLAHEKPPGETVPVDTQRPPPLSPVPEHCLP